MESAQENQTPPLPTTLVPSEVELARNSRFGEFMMRHQKEIWFGCWNQLLFMSTLIQDNPQLSDVRPAPTHTEGPMAFFEQNMAGSMEVIAMFYLARIPVGLVARGIEIMADKKIDPRIKVGVSLFLAMATSSALELIKKPSGTSLHGGIPDPIDAVGNVVAGIYVAVGHQVIDYLFKPRETSLFEQWWDKVSSLAESAKGIDQKLLARIGNWARGLSSPASPTDNVAVVSAPDVSDDTTQRDA